MAQVTMENHNPLGRLDNWKLSFDWMRDEFIDTMTGAYPSLVDSSDCIDGPQAKYYQALDFSNVLSCARRPTIIDLPLTKYNDSVFGLNHIAAETGLFCQSPWILASPSQLSRCRFTKCLRILTSLLFHLLRTGGSPVHSTRITSVALLFVSARASSLILVDCHLTRQLLRAGKWSATSLNRKTRVLGAVYRSLPTSTTQSSLARLVLVVVPATELLALVAQHPQRFSYHSRLFWSHLRTELNSL